MDWLLPYYEVDKLTNTIKALQAFYRGQIVVVGPVPHWIFPLRDSLFAFSRQGLMRGELPSRMGFQLNPATEIVDKKLRNWTRESNVGYLSPLRIFCDGEGCLTRVGPLTEDFLSLDNGQHLTQSASRYLARALQNDLMGYLPLRATK